VLEFLAYLRARGGTKFAIELHDLSVTGFRCGTSYTMRVGDSVWLTIPGLEAREARVVRRNGLEYGCEFAEPLHVAVLDHIAKFFHKRPR
jgi:PilZ domain